MATFFLESLCANLSTGSTGLALLGGRTYGLVDKSLAFRSSKSKLHSLGYTAQEGLHVLRGFAAAQLILERQSLRVNTEGVNPQSKKKSLLGGVGGGSTHGSRLDQ